MNSDNRIHRNQLYLITPVAVTVIIYVSYVITHRYPALGGGLYLMMAETIRRAGYSLPTHVPYYSKGGIPFGYPPLGFYIAALSMDLGISKIEFARLFPIIPLTGSIIAYTYFASELFEMEYRKGSIAATIIATSPAVLQYTLTAGGFVRATALLFTTIGLTSGFRAFKEKSWYYTGISTIIFAIVLATHLKYTLLLGTTYIVFYIYILIILSRDC